MRSRLPLSLLCFGALFLVTVPSVLAQEGVGDAESAAAEEPSPEPTLPPGTSVKLDISRRFLKNFLTDETALLPYKKADGSIRDLQSVFMIGSVQANHAIFWDSASCRLLGILDVKQASSDSRKTFAETDGDEESNAASPYLFKASGSHPLSNSARSSDSPVYFGFRLIEGKPEFLYTLGGLVIAERIWLDDGGRKLQQRFSLREPGASLRITIPEDWRSHVTSDSGTWENNVLSVEKEASVAGMTLTHELIKLEPEPDDSN